MNPPINELQLDLCQRYGVEHFPAPLSSKLGIALNVKDGVQLINGMRDMPAGDTCGWFIWAGEELSTQPDFFKSLHVAHIKSWCPEVEKYLGLPPGWRFLLADDYEDVWFDPSLLSVE
jgi:hypothetical protein